MIANIHVIRWGEHPHHTGEHHALVVRVGRYDAGIITRTPDGWVAFPRPRGPFSRFRTRKSTTHPSATAAVVAVTSSPFSRAAGSSPWSDIRFTDAAGRATRDVWAVAGVTAS